MHQHGDQIAEISNFTAHVHKFIVQLLRDIVCIPRGIAKQNRGTVYPYEKNTILQLELVHIEFLSMSVQTIERRTFALRIVDDFT